MSNQDALFEPISEEEYTNALAAPELATKKPKYNLDKRNQTTWWKLPTHYGQCTVPTHNEVQKMLTDEEKAYRESVHARMVFTIGDYEVCRDCWLSGVDLK